MTQSKKLMKVQSIRNDGQTSGRLLKKSRFFLFAIAFPIFALHGAMCSPQDDAAGGTANLDGNISAAVTRVRTWKEFDVPTEIKAAQLRLKRATPLKVILGEAPQRPQNSMDYSIIFACEKRSNS